MKITTFTTLLHATDNLIIRDVPVSSTVVEWPNHDLAIIDTGMAGNPQLLSELAEAGYSPHNFNLVINTHLHCDHIGGNQLFKNARILISRKEYQYEDELGKRLRQSQEPGQVIFRLGREVEEKDWAIARDLKKLAESYPLSLLVGDQEQLEFFEDFPRLPAAVSLLSTPGHSIDSHSVLIEGRLRKVLITGDALYHRDLWQEASVPGINYNEKMFRATAQQCSHFQGIIIPGHDHAYDNLTGQYMEEDSFRV